MQRAVFIQHIHKAIGKHDQEQDVCRTYISPINRKENIEEPRLFSRHIMEAVRQNNGSIGGFVKYAVILAGGNHISHDHHSQQDHGQQDIGVRQLDMEQFVLPLCAFQHMGSPSMKTCRARAVTSKGWAFHSTRSASLPTCREPFRSSMRSTWAGFRVTAFSASIWSMP